MPTTTITIENLEKALSTLQENAPEANEMTAFTNVTDVFRIMNDSHDNFLGATLTSFELGGELYSDFEKINDDYNKLMEGLAASIEAAKKAEEGGQVDPTGGPYTPTGGSPQETPTVTGTETPTPTTPEGTDPTSTTTPVTGTETPEVTTPPETTSEDPTGGKTGSETPDGTTPTAATGAIAGIVATLPDDIGGLGSPDGPEDPLHPNNPFGDHDISGEEMEGLDPVEAEEIRKKLKELGFSDEDIDKILSGGASAPKVEVDALKEALEKAVREHPELREELKNLYGFDIFDPDGTVNPDRLALAILMDNKNGTDTYSILQYLQTKYGITVVDPTDFTKLLGRLERLYKENPNLRDELMKRYGFDFFNPDGTINKDKLTLAMLMDLQNPNDDFNLLAWLIENYGEEEITALLGSVTKPTISTTSTTSSGSAAVPVAAGIGVAGAIAGGAAYLIGKKKDEEEDEEGKEEDDDIEEPEEKKEEKEEDDKEWLHDLGLGLHPDEDVDLEKVKPKETEERKKKDLMSLLAMGAGAATAAKVIKDKTSEDDEDDDSSEEEKEGE